MSKTACAISKIVIIIMLIMLIGTLLYVGETSFYEYAFNKGVDASFNMMRVTNVKETNDGYLILIRDNNNNLYMHTCRGAT